MAVSTKNIFRILLLALFLSLGNNISYGEAIPNPKKESNVLVRSKHRLRIDRRINHKSSLSRKIKKNKPNSIQRKRLNPLVLIGIILVIVSIIFAACFIILINNAIFSLLSIFLFIVSVIVGPILFITGLLLLILGLVEQFNKNETKIPPKKQPVRIAKVYLKEGLIVKGYIIEESENGFMKIQKKDGSIQHINLSSIEKIIR